MSHLITSQDFGSQDFLRAVCEPISQSTIAREPQDFFTRFGPQVREPARIFAQAAATRRMEVWSVSEPGFSADEVAGSKGN